MSETDKPPLIVSVWLDDASFAYLNALRQQHFPPERNVIDAHITLFHALPGAHQSAIVGHLSRYCQTLPPLTLYFDRLRSLGRGVAVNVDCPSLIERRQQLARHWWNGLSAQDRQRLRPHVTIQNKVAPAAAKTLLQQLGPRWVPFSGTGAGLRLWRYRGGPWEPVAQFAFAG